MKIYLLLFILLGSFFFAGCSEINLETVQPWEKGELSGDLLRPDLNTLEAKDWDHIYFSKEGTPVGFSLGGGGCGCN